MRLLWRASSGLLRVLSRQLLLLCIVLLLFSKVGCWDCICNPRECEALEPSGCPGLGVIVWDPCRCCKVCARTVGEMCGGFSGTCEPGLKCSEGACAPLNARLVLIIFILPNITYDVAKDSIQNESM